MLTVLSVGYSLAAVGPDAVGGSEQVLSALDAALVRAGHRSLVVAPHGSSVQGTVFTTPKLPSTLDDDARRVAQRRMARVISDVLQRYSVDLVHMHGLDFHQYLPPAGVPVLVTLHLPPDWYPDWIFTLQRPHTYLHCVSQSQASTCPPGAQLLPVIENGVPVDRLKAKHAKRGFALALARRWLRDLGVRHIRTGLSWADSFRPNADAWFDRQMSALEEFEVTLTYCFTPEHRGVAPHYTSPPLHNEEFAEFCARMTRRYAPASGTAGRLAERAPSLAAD